MKQLSILVLLLFSTTMIFAQQETPALPLKEKTKIDSLEWSTATSHDFGTIKLNSIVSYTFEFINTGKKPVTITKAEPSCSCTVPDYSKDPILPGGKGIVKVTFNAHKPGVIDKTVTLKLDRGEPVVLKISGEVIQ